MEKLISKIESMSKEKMSLSESVQALDEIHKIVDDLVKEKIKDSLILEIDKCSSSSRRLKVNVKYKDEILLEYDFTR